MVAEASTELLAVVTVALPQWVEASILQRAPHLQAEARAAGEECAAQLLPQLAALLATDIDEQRSTPLQLVRRAAAIPTRVLREAGVPPERRDPWQVEAEPDDHYQLSPAAWADLGPEAHEAGLRWGAAKAITHLRRHRPG